MLIQCRAPTPKPSAHREPHAKVGKFQSPVLGRMRPAMTCCRAAANQMRLFLHIGAYWLMWGLRAAMPRRSLWRVAQFDTLRLRLIKLAVRVEVLKRKLRLYLPRSTPNQPIFACALTRLSRGPTEDPGHHAPRSRVRSTPNAAAT